MVSTCFNLTYRFRPNSSDLLWVKNAQIPVDPGKIYVNLYPQSMAFNFGVACHGAIRDPSTAFHSRSGWPNVAEQLRLVSAIQPQWDVKIGAVKHCKHTQRHTDTHRDSEVSSKGSKETF